LFHEFIVKNILIIDKNPSLAEALAAQMSLPHSVKCQGLMADDPIHTIQLVNPDMVLLDPADIDRDLHSFVADLGGEESAPRLLAYSFNVTKSILNAAIAAGFAGCASKYCNLQQLEVAVAAVLGGGAYFDPHFAPLLAPHVTPADDGLSLREKEVLIRTAKGLASKQIALDLEISIKTVETYKARAVQKLGLSDRSKVFDYALEQGWIP
jgi:DNA-binding NarL/FixJ family response regulator